MNNHDVRFGVVAESVGAYKASSPRYAAASLPLRRALNEASCAAARRREEERRNRTRRVSR